jgi:predicted RNA-binding Zn ribbon-like protein
MFFTGYLKMTHADHDDPSQAPMLGDHPALDLLNTEACIDGEAVDYWHTGDDVLRWLEQHGMVAATDHAAIDRAGLLVRAKALRTLARRLIAGRAEQASADIAGLNQYLHGYLSAPHLQHDAAGKLVLSRIPRGETIASLLGPAAEAVAHLLAEGDFSLVRQCEHPDCVLWFYDRTKAHKRRWCSMAVCGNRYKAAQFRKKNGGGKA